ncbi:MAG TPA: MCE family protein [Caldithrix abyssi]|uniref:MCE family protein n=1 Tax=Caldithrix abyssi TaxID=187145 RepID=A0A7V5PQW7_CALAY|nr:MCE family protein [Caldithrix abyssi]
MITKAQKIRLGIFIAVSLILFLALIAVLSINRIFKEKDIYYIAYRNTSVTGLDVGSSVKYLGINVGSVQKIQIDPNDISRVIVTVSINKGTPIKKDVVADISTIGITGIKLIELRGGTNEAPLLQPGEYIQPGKSLTANITGKAEIIAEKVELALNNLIALTQKTNQEKIFRVFDSTEVMITNVNQLIKSNRHAVNSSLTHLDSSLVYLASASKTASHAIRRLDFFVQSDSFRTTLNNIAQIADKLNKANIYNLDEQLNLAVDKLNHLLYQVDLIISLNASRFNQSMNRLNEAIEALNHAARQIDENPGILLGGAKPENPPDEQLEH